MNRFKIVPDKRSPKDFVCIDAYGDVYEWLSIRREHLPQLVSAIQDYIGRNAPSLAERVAELERKIADIEAKLSSSTLLSR